MTQCYYINMGDVLISCPQHISNTFYTTNQTLQFALQGELCHATLPFTFYLHTVQKIQHFVIFVVAHRHSCCLNYPPFSIGKLHFLLWLQQLVLLLVPFYLLDFRPACQLVKKLSNLVLSPSAWVMYWKLSRLHWPHQSNFSVQ